MLIHANWDRLNVIDLCCPVGLVVVYVIGIYWCIMVSEWVGK